jgi:NADH dehydrogenase (ubiquinone) Fe-S protein 5
MNQVARVQRMQEAYRKAEAAHPRETAPKPEQIRNLGLLGKEEDTKQVLGR